MSRALVTLAVLLAACTRSQPAATSPPDCAALVADNAVRTEMDRLECVLQRVVTAIGRDDLPSVGPMIETIDTAKQATEHALESGTYKLQGDLASFKAMDEAFHHALVGLVDAAAKRDHAATATALGAVLTQCQGCHAAFRPRSPGSAQGK